MTNVNDGQSPAAVVLGGTPDGPYEFYHEDGQLYERGTWSMGQKCGEWIDEYEPVTYGPCPPGLEDGN